MIPMVFWASLVPWLQLIQAALRSCNLPKVLLTTRGFTGRSTIIRIIITTNPIINPASGARIMGLTTLGQRPVDHFRTDQLFWAVATAAPQRPPIKACEELLGRPSH